MSNSRAANAAGYVDASTVVIRPGDAVVFKVGYRTHKDDDEWLERNGDTVREVRGDEVKIGPSANDWAKKSDLMVWHNSVRSTNAVVAKALNACGTARNERDASVKRQWIAEQTRFMDNLTKSMQWVASHYKEAKKFDTSIKRDLESAKRRWREQINDYPEMAEWGKEINLSKKVNDILAASPFGSL